MGRADFYKNGDYNAICDECGKKYKFSQLKKRWDGLYVCEREWEPRHPQDYLKGIRDNMSVPISRPEAGNSFIDQIGWSVSSIISIVVVAFRVKTIIIGVSSLASIITNFYPVQAVKKTVNGFAVNKTTLG
jgi:hypothetical protein